MRAQKGEQNSFSDFFTSIDEAPGRVRRRRAFGANYHPFPDNPEVWKTDSSAAAQLYLHRKHTRSILLHIHISSDQVIHLRSVSADIDDPADSTIRQEPGVLELIASVHCHNLHLHESVRQSNFSTGRTGERRACH